MSAQEKAKDLLFLLIEKEDYESRLKDVNKKIVSLETELYDDMTEEQVDSIKISGIEFKPIEDQYFSLAGEYQGKKWDEAEGFHAFLAKIGEGGAIKTKPTVHPQTRLAILKRYVDDGGMLPEWIEEKYHNTVKYNKSAIRRMANGTGAEG